MLKLLVFPEAFGVGNPSPFCLKTQMLLALSQLPHELVTAMPNRGPRGKLPTLIDGAQIIPDSALIQRHMAEKYDFDLDRGLSPRQFAEAQAFRRLAEEHLYWAVVYSRFVEHAATVRDTFFATVPAPLRGLVFSIVRREIVSQLRAHGMGRRTREEIFQLASEDIAAIAQRLGDGGFFFGDLLTSIDTALYGVLANIIVPPLDTPLKAAAGAYPVLSAYIARCEAAAFKGRRAAT